MTAFQAVKINIEDLYEEARVWLDGTAIETQAQADAVNTLKASIKLAAKAAEDARLEEITPHQKTVADIQARYNELIGKNKTTTGLAVKAEEACNDALRPYLLEVDRQQREKARLAREEADKLQAEALAAIRARDTANLAQIEEAETLVKAAKAAETAAGYAEKERPHAKGDGRATGLRTVYRAVMVNRKEASAWVWIDHNDAVMELVQNLADKAIRAGARQIPGFEIHEDRIV
jgi:hypothetical protein